MAYVTVPKDLTKIKSKVMFNLNGVCNRPKGFNENQEQGNV